jgi:hypothetical protein
MAYVGTDFDVATKGERQPYALDFVRDIADGDTLVSAIWTCEVVEGIDPNASSCISGPASVSGTKTFQFVILLVPGVRYRLTATVITAVGSTVVLYSHVTCEPEN